MEYAQPISFEPIAMERVWGGRRLESLLGKSLPPGEPVGESWELVDRDEAQSVVHSGPLKGSTLHDLWTQHRVEVFGQAHADHPSARFPLLIKLLDARERLSVQVHPPAHAAAALNGEPKTEAWYFLDCLPGASIYAGLKRGATRADLESAISNGTVEDVIARQPVQSGDSIFIPSGRLHAIGEGCLIVEVQQNSDTTYRVFDWNRTGLDGSPRQLHIDESLASIDFDDFEPELTDRNNNLIAVCDHFVIERWDLGSPQAALDGDAFALFTVISGQVGCGEEVFPTGSFFLVPASMADARVRPVGDGAAVLRSSLPVNPRNRTASAAEIA
ncbi:MAG: type I phosphomannose isomerase catalytic subunit [Chthoniobacterales bacterium]